MSEGIVAQVDALLDVLGMLGVLETPLARRIIAVAENLRRNRDARRRLEGLLQEAEENFQKEAQAQGLDVVTDWVVHLPVHDLPTFRRALESLREHWDEQALADRLAQEFAAIPGLKKEDQRRALALYLACLRARLVADKDFSPVITALSVLRTEAGVRRLVAQMDALYSAVNRLLGLPGDLVAWPVRPPPPVPELRADLLHPRYRLVPFTGRASREALEDLLAWARGLEQARPPVGLRIYIGPGGVGKTRLLIEAGEALREEGWWVGFLRAGRFTNENATLLSTDARPMLLIADYIADRLQEVRTLLRQVARAADEDRRSAPLAIVFLERAFPVWLEEDLRSYSDPDYIGWFAFLSLPTVEKAPYPLPVLAEDDREALFAAALDRFRELVPAAGGLAQVRYPELPDTPFHVLLLAMLAAGGVQVDRAADPNRILEYAWGRERDAWRRHLQPLFRNQPELRLTNALNVVEDLTVVATLGRTFPTPSALEAFLKTYFRSFPDIDWDEVVAVFSTLFPRAEGTVVPPIVPDPLADFVLMRRLIERPDLIHLALPTAEETVAKPRKSATAARSALDVLARLWKRAPNKLVRELVTGWMTHVAESLATWPTPAWKALDRVLPAPGHASALCPFLITVYQARLARTPEEEKEARARLCGKLSKALSASGRRKEARAAIKQQVTIYRQLAKQNPQAFLLDLVQSLNRLSALARRKEAVTTTREVVTIYRQLAQQSPRFLPSLVKSLHNLGNRLSALGRHKEALATIQEAVEIRRQLAQQSPPQASPASVAKSLVNLGNCLSALGRHKEALATIQEAVEIRRQLAQQSPRFLPGLVLTLNTYGRVLLVLGRAEEALKAFAEGLQTLLPFLRALRVPPAFSELAAALRRGYLQACQRAGKEPDGELVEEVGRLLSGSDNSGGNPPLPLGKPDKKCPDSRAHEGPPRVT